MSEQIKTYKLKYIESISRMFLELKYHGRNFHLPQKEGDNIIKVTETERKCLLGLMNGNKHYFQEVKQATKPKESGDGNDRSK